MPRSDGVTLGRREQGCENNNPRSVPNILGTGWVVGFVPWHGASGDVQRYNNSLPSRGDECDEQSG